MEKWKYSESVIIFSFEKAIEDLQKVAEKLRIEAENSENEYIRVLCQVNSLKVSLDLIKKGYILPGPLECDFYDELPF